MPAARGIPDAGGLTAGEHAQWERIWLAVTDLIEAGMAGPRGGAAVPGVAVPTQPPWEPQIRQNSSSGCVTSLATMVTFRYLQVNRIFQPFAIAATGRPALLRSHRWARTGAFGDWPFDHPVLNETVR
jgi:hypothetical protein